MTTHLQRTREQVTLPNGGPTLEMIRVQPRAQPNATPVKSLAVLCHPWSWLGGRMQDPVLRDLIEPFHARGFEIILLNSRGVGNSSGRASLSGLAEAEDLQALVTLLAGDSNVDKIVLLGYSHGSLPVSHYPPNPKVSHILLSYPLSPLPLLTFFHHNAHSNALRTLVSNSDSNVLIVYGSQDQFTAMGKFDSWFDGLQDNSKGRLERLKLENGDHFWRDDKANDDLLNGVGKWLDSI